MVDFIFVMIELFRYLWQLIHYKRKSVEVGVSRRGVGDLKADFRGKGASPTNHCWCQSSRVIALACGITISAVDHLVLSQSTHVTDRRTDGQNYNSQDRPHICSRGKNELLVPPKQLSDRKLLQHSSTGGVQHSTLQAWDVELQMHKIKMHFRKYFTVTKTHNSIKKHKYHYCVLPIQTSVCHQLHVLIVKVGGRQTVQVSKCQRTDGFVRPVTAWSFA